MKNLLISSPKITTQPVATSIIIITILVILIPFFKSTSSTTTLPTKDDQDLNVAIQEMQKANYYTFIMLLKMSPLDPNFFQNVTFLMPKDSMLSKTVIPKNEVASFLRRHSIPSPLLFEHLLYIPTGSFLPSALPEYMMNVTKGGVRRSFFLNDVKIVSPNICTAGSSIRCHGIDGVLSPVSNISMHTCSNISSSVPPQPPSPAASPAPLPPLPVLFVPPLEFMVPAPLPSEGSQFSGSSQLASDREELILMSVLVLLVIDI